MFYVSFIFTVLFSYFLIWTGANLYAIFHLNHKAEVMLGRILVLLQKKQEVLNKFMNEITIVDEGCKTAAFEIRELKSLMEGEKALSRRLLLDRNIDEKIDLIKTSLSDNSPCYHMFNQITEITKDMLEQKEKYNKVILQLGKFYTKSVIRHLVKAFHIKVLEQL